MKFDINYLGHSFVWNKSYNGIGLEFKCSICSIIAHKFQLNITFVNEKRWVIDKFSCKEFLIKKLLE
jgi:hypothetical protein